MAGSMRDIITFTCSLYAVAAVEVDQSCCP